MTWPSDVECLALVSRIQKYTSTAAVVAVCLSQSPAKVISQAREWLPMRGVPLLLAALLLACQACHGVGDHPACRQKDAGLQIRSDRFFLDGKPLQIISGRWG